MKAKDVEIDFSFVLASSVHDMKNSLGMLLNTINDVMEKYPPQNEAHAHSYAILEYEAARINSELIQLLSLYRLDHDHIYVNIDVHFIVDIVNDQLARNHGVFRSRNINVELACDSLLQGYFDADLIGGIINNILVNSARYCKNNIRICAQKMQDYLCITIEDDGPGYPEGMLDREEDFDAHAGFADGRPHLGLLLAHKIALMHQVNERSGYLCLSNGGKLGGGCFSLYLP